MITPTNILLAIIILLIIALIQVARKISKKLSLFVYDGFPDLMDQLNEMDRTFWVLNSSLKKLKKNKKVKPPGPPKNARKVLKED